MQQALRECTLDKHTACASTPLRGKGLWRNEAQGASQGYLSSRQATDKQPLMVVLSNNVASSHGTTPGPRTGTTTTSHQGEGPLGVLRKRLQERQKGRQATGKTAFCVSQRHPWHRERGTPQRDRNVPAAGLVGARGPQGQSTGRFPVTGDGDPGKAVPPQRALSPVCCTNPAEPSTGKTPQAYEVGECQFLRSWLHHQHAANELQVPQLAVPALNPESDTTGR